MADRLAGLLPRVKVLAEQLLQRASAAGIALVVTQGLRTYAEQDALYAQGRSTPGKIVTRARGGQSAHNFGRAFDVAFVSKNGIAWDGPWDEIGAMGQELGLEWGGAWPSFKDRPHFQLMEGKTLAELRAEHDAPAPDVDGEISV